jgi:hypothetical protein
VRLKPGDPVGSRSVSSQALPNEDSCKSPRLSGRRHYDLPVNLCLGRVAERITGSGRRR